MLDSASLAGAVAAVAPPAPVYWPLYIMLVFLLALMLGGLYIWVKRPKTQENQVEDSEKAEMKQHIASLLQRCGVLESRVAAAEASHGNLPAELNALRDDVRGIHRRIDDMFGLITRLLKQ